MTPHESEQAGAEQPGGEGREETEYGCSSEDETFPPTGSTAQISHGDGGECDRSEQGRAVGKEDGERLEMAEESAAWAIDKSRSAMPNSCCAVILSGETPARFD